MTPRPTHILRHEHRVIEQGLRALDGMCLRLNAGDNVPPEALARALDFIQNFADRFHHTREEEYLFTALEISGFGDDALRYLQEEHEIERDLLAELEFTVEEYRFGDTDAVYRFVEASDRFSKHLIGHMQKEDNLLFRIAEEFLDEDAKLTLMQQLALRNSEGGGEWNQKYEHLAADLEREWTV